MGYAHENAMLSFPHLETVDLQGLPDLVETPWQLLEMATLRTLNVARCPHLSSIGFQFPTQPSELSSLILDGCLALTTLPEGLSIKLSKLTELGLANCNNLIALPKWLNVIERNGAGVIRPSHLS